MDGRSAARRGGVDLKNLSMSEQTDVTVRQATIFDLDLIAPLFDAYRQFYRKPSDLGLARRFLLERLQHNQSIVFPGAATGRLSSWIHAIVSALLVGIRSTDFHPQRSACSAITP